MKKRIVSLIALACVLYCIGSYFYGSVPMQFEIEGAVRIKIFSGSTGQSLETADPEVIATVTQSITSPEFTRGKKEKTDGFSYTVWWYDADGKEIECLHLISDNTVIKNDRHYTVDSNDKIDLSYFEGLFPPTE